MKKVMKILFEKTRKKIKKLKNNEKINQDELHKLLNKSRENADLLLNNRNEILQRRNDIMSNKETISINKSKIFFGS